MLNFQTKQPMKKVLTILIITFLYCGISFADNWKIKNKWKVSCGIADKESLVVNGNLKKAIIKKNSS